MESPRESSRETPVSPAASDGAGTFFLGVGVAAAVVAMLAALLLHMASVPEHEDRVMQAARPGAELQAAEPDAAVAARADGASATTAAAPRLRDASPDEMPPTF